MTRTVAPIAPALSVSVARGTVITFAGHAASLARPAAFAVFARIHGPDALGALFMIWTVVELGARLASLGLDRGLRRWPDGNRAVATAGALVTSAVAGLAVAILLIVALPYIVPLAGGAVLPARLVIGVTLPLLASGSVALRAARGEAQIAMYVLARGVVEPVLLLVAGLVVSAFAHGTTALLAAFLVSVVGGAAVAAATVVRASGLAPLARALVRPRRWPLRQLVPTSIPLGIADLLQSAQGKIDLVAVALVSYSGQQIAGYAIAAELASGFTQVRQGYDQVIAPIAAELRGRRGDLASLLTEGIRWNALIAVPLALALVVFPGAFLDLFGGASGAASVLVILVIGRAIETVSGPAASVISVVGDPRLALRGAAIGVAITIGGSLALSSLGPAGIAAASSLGAIATGVLAVFWLAKLEGIAPCWSALAKVMPLVAVLGAPLVAARIALGAPHGAALAAVMVAWIAGYIAVVTSRSRRRRPSAHPTAPLGLVHAAART